MKPPPVPYSLSALRLDLYSERIAFTGLVVIEHAPPTEEAALVRLEVKLFEEGGSLFPAIKSIEAQVSLIGMRCR
jgi:hypothetical protein